MAKFMERSLRHHVAAVVAVVGSSAVGPGVGVGAAVGVGNGVWGGQVGLSPLENGRQIDTVCCTGVAAVGLAASGMTPSPVKLLALFQGR